YDNQAFGLVFSNCRITGEVEVKTYLGRPWRDFANVTYLNTEMSSVVRPEGWQNWNLPEREKTARYAEFNSIGPGANPRARVSWSHQLMKSQAKTITITKVLGGADGWDPLARGKVKIDQENEKLVIIEEWSEKFDCSRMIFKASVR